MQAAATHTRLAAAERGVLVERNSSSDLVDQIAKSSAMQLFKQKPSSDKFTVLARGAGGESLVQ